MRLSALRFARHRPSTQVRSLLPTVREPSGYHGIAEGTEIVDHDLALAYVLERDALALPAYAALTPPQQAAVRFTQAELGFNHGWLVQVTTR